MALTSTFAAGSKVTAAKENQAIPIGARYEQKSAQNVSTASDTLCKFDTAVETNTDVTVSGTGNTQFLLNRIGRWHVDVAIRYAGNAGGNERHVFIQTGGPTFDQTQRKGAVAHANVSTAPATVTCSTTFKIAAATTLIVGLFQNSGNTVATDVAYGGTNHIALTWLGP